ncbi:MAG: hypothetical protein QXL19_09300 [Ignisphaera sp.]
MYIPSNLFSQFINWSKQIEEMRSVYCLNNFKINYSDDDQIKSIEIQWSLRKCSLNDTYIHEDTGNKEFIDTDSLTKIEVLYHTILCYDINNGNTKKLMCWIKKDGNILSVDGINISFVVNNEEEKNVINIDIIYLYYNKWEYVFVFNSKKGNIVLLKNTKSREVRRYNAIRDIVEAKDKDKILYVYLRGYSNAKKAKDKDKYPLSIIDISLDYLGIEDCSFYKKLKPFMIVSDGNSEIYDVHILNSINDTRAEKKDEEEQREKIKKLLEQCIERGYLN